MKLDNQSPFRSIALAMVLALTVFTTQEFVFGRSIKSCKANQPWSDSDRSWNYLSIASDVVVVQSRRHFPLLSQVDAIHAITERYGVPIDWFTDSLDEYQLLPASWLCFPWLISHHLSLVRCCRSPRRRAFKERMRLYMLVCAALYSTINLVIDRVWCQDGYYCIETSWLRIPWGASHYQGLSFGSWSNESLDSTLQHDHAIDTPFCWNTIRDNTGVMNCAIVDQLHYLFDTSTRMMAMIGTSLLESSRWTAKGQ